MSKHGMPEHEPGKHQNGDGFEHEDVSTTPLFGFLLGLLVTGVLVYYIIWGMFHFMDAYERTHQQSKSPMVQIQADTREPDTARTREKIQREFPQPRLEDDERTEINDFRYQQDETLSSYGWVDQNAGVVRIPIDQAMKLIAQRGLPTIPQAGTSPAAAVSQKAPAAKASGKGTKQ
jgi:hypothetical protein